MIVVKVISRKKLRVIHYRGAANAGGKAIITEENIVIDPSVDVIYRIDYDRGKSYTGEEAIDRALERLGECSYSLLSNNCESFCTWVKMNKNKSSQAETAAAGMGLAAAAAAVGTVALLSFAVFKAFSGSNKSSK
jgi:hypothetical protein